MSAAVTARRVAPDWPGAPGLLDRIAGRPAALPVPAASLHLRTDEGPAAFHALLHELVRGARRRISLASLYVGTGAMEQALVDALRAALRANPALELRLVLDHCRARRRTDNGTSVAFVAPLCREFPGQVELYLHRMPQFAGPSAWLPSPLDECVAVCHFKALVVDDTAVLTGANLSDEYFHCRQARYLVVDDAPFSTMLHGVVDTVARHSQRVQVEGGPGERLASSERPATAVGDAVIERIARAAGAATGAAGDTWLVPVFQHPALALQQEREVLRQLLSWSDGELVIATPYTNFPREYVEALRNRLDADAPGPTRLVVPSGNSHSFTTGKGLKALVPGIYLHREREIMGRLELARGAVELAHWERPGWVFHAKGVWLLAEHETATVIGSSSFGERSVTRDFDLSCLVVTRDARLRRAFADEVRTLLGHARPPAPVARPGLVASELLSPLVKSYM